LVFGFWNSREKDDTRLAIKFSRIVTSTIRASNVAPLKRSAQFNPAFDPSQIGLSDDTNLEASQESKDEKSPLSQLGLRSAPAVDTHGGVRVFGKIVRQTQVNLVALRALACVKNSEVLPDETMKLRRYLLALSLVAARVQSCYNLRQGCLLIGKKNTPPLSEAVFPDGARKSFDWDFGNIQEFAVDAARAFGVYQESPKPREYCFDREKVTEAIEKTREKPGKKSKTQAKPATA
jgi:hypothetical protein